MAREIELKFDVEPGGAARIAKAEPLAASPAVRSRFETLYFDTPDRALRRAGYSLRIRRAGERYIQTVKRRKASSAGLFVRQEWEVDVPDFVLRADVLRKTPLKRWAARAEAGEFFALIRTEFLRSAWQVRHRGSRIEVVLDRGRICVGEIETRVSELEMELKRGRPSALFDLARTLAAAGPMRLGVMSKSGRGYALADGLIGRAAKAESAQIATPATEAAAFAAIAYACLRHFRLNEIVLLTKQDQEALHQARVALRRLRAAMALFRPTLDGKPYETLRGELGWFAGHFGEARDLDLLLARLRDAKVDESLLTPLRSAHAKAHRRVSRALRSKRSRALFLELILWIETGSWRDQPRASSDLRRLAVQQLNRRWRKVARQSRKLAGLGPENRHELRIAAKAMRYTAEFLAPLHAARPVAAQRDRFISALKALQDRLGELNDAWTAAQVARDLPARLREAIAAAHPDKESKVALAAASQALARAEANAEYWRN